MSENTNREVIHRLVKNQYDRYPYPAAQENLTDFISRKSFQAGCPSVFSHLYWPHREKRLNLDILVAGCGTMQAPKFAVNLPDARITAIDICDNSIEHTNRLLRLHDIRNVITRRLPVEDAATLGKEFDLVVSTGVLHHLPDPAEGLDALQSVLRTDGSMYLMLYGKYGRDGIYYLQELFRRAGLSAASVTPADLALVRQLLELLPPHHPVATRADFFKRFDVGDEELVDLFLHPQDRGYSIPDITRLLDGGGMKLQSMLFRAHYAPRCSGLAASGLMGRVNLLPDIEQLAIGELFRAAVHMHFFIACRKDRDEEGYLLDLDAPQWKSLIPVRSPVLQQEMVATTSGNRAMLYSPMHQFSDIRCVLREEELALFDLSNNRLTIGEIQTAVATRFPVVSDDNLVREFYRKMLDHDYLSYRGPGSTG
jgi:SAM-dependent methyltransferase